MIIKSILKGIFLIIFSPTKFSVYATSLNVKEQQKRNPKLTTEDEEGKAFVKEMEGYNLDRANKIRSSFFFSMLATFLSIVLGVAFGVLLKNIFGSPSILSLNILQIIGVGTLLSATLSVLSHEIESYGKGTLAEKINRALFKSQYILGSFLFFLAYSWGA